MNIVQHTDLPDLQPNTELAPFTKDALRKDIAMVLLAIVRQLHFVLFRDDGTSTNRCQIALLGLDPALFDGAAINDPDLTPEDLGITYEHIQGASLTQALEALYDFAFDGVIDQDKEAMHSESVESWCAQVLHDMAQSACVESLADFMPPLREAVQRCVQVCEVADARQTLEGHDDSFMGWSEHTGAGLSIRQMALLSGMTEASIRTLANPKRKNALETRSDGRNTYVEPETAKAWLKAKGRYIPIKRVHQASQLDLAKHRFGTCDDLLIALDQRLRYVLASPDGRMARATLQAIRPDLLDERESTNPALRLEAAHLSDSRFMVRLGEALSLPGDLLALRAAETVALETLRDVERRLSAALKA